MVSIDIIIIRFFANIEKSGDNCIKIFRQNEQRNKKIKKKMLFLPAMMADGSQGLREKNTLFGEQRRKGRFFPKQPEGLDLDGLGNQG